MILLLLLKILNLKFNGKLPEEVKTSEILTALKDLKGANKYTLGDYFSDFFPEDEERSQHLHQIFSDYSGKLEVDPVKDYLIKKGFPDEEGFITTEDIETIIGTLGEKQKVKPNKPEKIMDIEGLVRALLKLIQYQKCGDNVDFLQLYPKEKFYKLVDSVFGKQITILDIYTKEELEDEVMWNCEDRSNTQAIKTFLLNKYFTEEYLTSEILNSLVQK